MTTGKSFKRLVRARAAATGQSYTAVLRRLQAKAKDGGQMTSNSSNDGHDDVHCSFCGKSQREVAKLVAGPGVYICDECIRLGYAIVAEGGSATGGDQPPHSGGLFQRFGDRSRAALVEAEREAGDLGHNFVGTEHLLLGVLHVVVPPVVDLLAAHGVTLSDARARIADIIGPSDGEHHGQRPFTPRAKTALELSLQASEEAGHAQIEPEDVLLALLAEGGGVAGQLLTSVGVTPEMIRDRLAGAT